MCSVTSGVLYNTQLFCWVVYDCNFIQSSQAFIVLYFLRWFIQHCPKVVYSVVGAFSPTLD